MPTAPRFVGEGVRVGSMPTPQAQPADGIARGLQDLGQGIAQAGRGIEAYAQGQREQAAERERQAKIAKASAATAGQNAFEKWKQRMDAAYNTFKVEAVGEHVGPKRGQFISTLEGPADEFIKDLSPEAVAEFNQRREFQAQSYRDASGVVALQQTRAFTLDTASRELGEAQDQAAKAYAVGDMDSFRMQHGRALDAGERVYGVTGQKFNYDEFTAGAKAGALKYLRETGSHAAVADLYRKNKGQFGAQETQAAALAQDSVDFIESQEYLAANAAQFQDDEGRFKTPDDLADAMTNMRPGMAKHVSALVAQAHRAYRERSEATAKALMDTYEQAAMTMQADVFYKDENTLRAFTSLPDDLRESVLARERDIQQFGPRRSNPDIISRLELAARSAPGSEQHNWYLRSQMASLPLSASDREQWTKRQADDAARGGDFTDEQAVDKVARKLWQQQNKTDLPSFPAPGKDWPSAEAKKAWADYEAVRTMALGIVKDPAQKLNIRREDDIAKAVAAAMTPLTTYESGVLSPTAVDTTAANFVATRNPTAADLSAAGVTANDPPHARMAKVLAYDQKQRQDRMMKQAEQAAREEAEAEARRAADEAELRNMDSTGTGWVGDIDRRIQRWYRSLGVN